MKDERAPLHPTDEFLLLIGIIGCVCNNYCCSTEEDTVVSALVQQTSLRTFLRSILAFVSTGPWLEVAPGGLGIEGGRVRAHSTSNGRFGAYPTMMNSICGLFLPIEGNNDDMSQLSLASKAIPYSDEDEAVSPFIAYNDGYMWPDVYSELDECIESSILVCAMAELRKLAKRNELFQSAKILKTPVTHRQVMDFVIKNQEYVELSAKCQNKAARLLILLCCRVFTHLVCSENWHKRSIRLLSLLRYFTLLPIAIWSVLAE